MKMMKKATKSKATKKVKTGSADTGVSFDMMAGGGLSRGIIKLKPKGSADLMPAKSFKAMKVKAKKAKKY